MNKESERSRKVSEEKSQYEKKGKLELQYKMEGEKIDDISMDQKR